MRVITIPLAAIVAVLAIWSGSAAAQTDRLIVELNKFESIDNGCRTFFLFRNQTVNAFQGFEMSLAILDDEGIIDRLLTVDAGPGGDEQANAVERPMVENLDVVRGIYAGRRL